MIRRCAKVCVFHYSFIKCISFSESVVLYSVLFEHLPIISLNSSCLLCGVIFQQLQPFVSLILRLSEIMSVIRLLLKIRVIRITEFKVFGKTFMLDMRWTLPNLSQPGPKLCSVQVPNLTGTICASVCSGEYFPCLCICL